MTEPPEHVAELVRELFTGRAAQYGPFVLEDAGETLVADSMYRYTVTDDGPRAGGTVYALTIFVELGSALAGPLWEQEVRALLRISNLGHRGLQTIHGGGYNVANKLAWVITGKVDYSLRDGGASYYQSRRAEAVRQLLELADGLAVLHGQGLVHRNLWPGTIDVETSGDGEDEPPRLRIARFELSSMLTNLLRGTDVDPETGTSELRARLRADFSRAENGSALPYLAPERLRFLLGDGSEDLVETDRGDVFGLGVIAWEWFLGDLPDHAGGLVGPEVSDAELLAAIGRVHDTMRSRLQGTALPKALRRVLGDMLAREPNARATSAQVVGELTRRFDEILAMFEPDHAADDLLVLFMPEESKRTLHAWGWAVLDPSTPEGIAEITEIVENDLRGARLVHAPDGAVGYVTSTTSDEKKRRAKWVLIGRRAAWFSVENRPAGGGPFASGGFGEPMDDVLRLMYPLPLHVPGARTLLNAPVSRRISSVTALPSTMNKSVLDSRRRGRPKWRPLLESVQTNDVGVRESTFLRALRWLLEYQAAEMALRSYPFVRNGPANGSRVELVYDEQRARARTSQDDLVTLLAPRRPAFGDFFESEEAFGKMGELEFCPDDDPGRGIGSIRDAERLDAVTLSVTPVDGAVAIPQHGWLRPADDWGTQVSLSRQRLALIELESQRGLLGQLQSPRSARTARERWRDAGRGLKGSAPSVVQEILSTAPFYALHGPPGTGKTTVVAHAIEAFVSAEPGARILVSAQANDSLDNLAIRILKRLRGRRDVVSLRIGNDDSRIAPEMRAFRLENLNQTVVARLRAVASARIEARLDPEPVRELLREWCRELDVAGLELRERIRRGASIVFATTSGANAKDLQAVEGFAAFDWVIVEEAAKAWPTELAIPLVRGVRWTLIGDHRQLPAFRRRDVSQVLQLCAEQDALRSLKAHGDARKEYEDVFDFFRHLFDPETLDHRPVNRLLRQFRMREPIAEVVSAAFYELRGDPALITDPSTEIDSGITRPQRLVGRSLVWLDTEDSCAQEARWGNPEEAKLVNRLITHLAPLSSAAPETPDHERLAILTAWHAQRRMLERTLGPELMRFVHTVDSFQGQEAEIVVISLVRDRAAGDSVEARLGHLADEQRANVMLSRAKRLCVIVGSYRHFAGSGSDFWSTVCERVESQGLVFSCAEVLG